MKLKIDDAINYLNDLKEIEAAGQSVHIGFEMDNTGIAVDPIATHRNPGYYSYCDLGGRSLTLTIEVENQSLSSKMRELYGSEWDDLPYSITEKL